jgi:hypothetical protein
MKITHYFHTLLQMELACVLCTRRGRAEIFPPTYNLLPSEIEALKHAIDKNHLDDQGWTSDDQGRIKHKGRAIFKVGYVTAIKKVLSSCLKDNERKINFLCGQ